MNFDQAWRLLEYIQSQIRVFDGKAQIALGINGLLIGLIVAELLKIAELGDSGLFWRPLLGYVLAGAGLVSSAVSIGFCIAVIRPRIEFKQPRSHFFYCHIVEKYASDFDSFSHAIRNIDAHTAYKELTSQILSNSLVCDLKAKKNRPVIPLTGAALILFALSVPPYASTISSLARRHAVSSDGSKTVVLDFSRQDRHISQPTRTLGAADQRVRVQP